MKKAILTITAIVCCSFNVFSQVQVTEEWVNIFNGVEIAPSLVSGGLAIDVNSNVYVTGITLNTLTGGDFVTIKYNKSGAELWVRTFSSAGNFSDGGEVIVLDADCNAYVAGEYRGGFATIKYDSTGTIQWVAIHDSTGFFTSLGAIFLDEAGNVYITGQIRRDFVTIKYDNDGNQQWVATLDDTSFIFNQDIPADMAVDKGGNVYVTGQVGASSAFLTIKYDANGIEQWIVKEDAVGIFESSLGLAIDTSSNVYIAGISKDALFQKVVTIKYDKDGNQIWRSEHRGDTVIVSATFFFLSNKIRC